MNRVRTESDRFMKDGGLDPETDLIEPKLSRTVNKESN